MISRVDLRKYEGLEPEDIALAEGLEIIEVDDMPSRMEDMFCLDTIVIRSGLAPEERRWRIAHCLGHHFLHKGTQGNGRRDRVIFNPRDEREADVFAGYMISCRTSPEWVRELYWTMEPWKLEPWEIVEEMHRGFFLVEKDLERAARMV